MKLRFQGRDIETEAENVDEEDEREVVGVVRQWSFGEREVLVGRDTRCRRVWVMKPAARERGSVGRVLGCCHSY